MERRWWIVIGVGALATALVVVALALHDTATPLDEDSVTASFAGAVGDDPGEPGVYSYTTTGHEAVDALNGARHDYPSTTFMTIAAGPCGPVVRWDALRERWFEWSHCGPDLAVTMTRSYHEWFGVGDLEVEECATPLPLAASAAGIACVAGETTETYDLDLIGIEKLTIDGVEVDAVHVRRSSTVAGGSNGSTVADVWRHSGSPLILRLELSTRTVSSSAIGDVAYEEDVVLLLDSLLPSG